MTGWNALSADRPGSKWVLREQCCQVAARTYRSWKRAGRVVAARTVSDAHVVDAVRDIAWTTKVDPDGVLVRKLAQKGSTGAGR